VEELFAVGPSAPDSPDPMRTRRFDAQSWALVHFLMVGDDGVHRPRLSRFLMLVSEGREPGEAARVALGDLRELDVALAAYVNRNVFDTQSIQLTGIGPSETTPPRSLSAAEALTLRGAIHVAGERFDDARDCLEAALRLDPELAWAHETAAALAWADDDPAGARAAVARALALDPARPWARRLGRRVSGPPTLGGARTLCDHGDLETCAQLGAWLLDGEGATPDPADGLSALETACEGGFAPACRRLSWRFREGEGLPPDAVRAVEFLEKACRAGDGNACLAAAGEHREGRGVPVDPVSSVRMLELACTRGETMGCMALAWALHSGEGVTRDVERAAALYLDQCQAGNGSCCSRLGLLYLASNGLPTDTPRARDLLARGCALGDPAGCLRLEALGAPAP
jgi:TPR repeat protein